MSEEEKGPKARRMSEVEAAKDIERLSTGVYGLDQCLAETDDGPQGVPLGTSILLAGMPGSGKSTLTLVMADAAGSAPEGGKPRTILIISGEERLPRVRARWDRLHLGQKGADPYIVRIHDAEEIAQLMIELAPVLTIVDSVQSISMGGSRKYDAQYEAVEYMERIAVGMGSSAIFINHVSKTGQHHAGAQALAHLVDIHMHMAVNAKKGERNLEIRKNRYGRAGFQVPVSIGPSSITVGTPAPITDGGLVTSRGALEKAAEVAYDLLVKGESLNGYDFDKVQPMVSGNLWRTGLELATKRLARDGYTIEEFKLKGRRTFRVAAASELKAEGPTSPAPVGPTIGEDASILLDLKSGKKYEDDGKYPYPVPQLELD